jgi:hypothetical protein
LWNYPNTYLSARHGFDYYPNIPSVTASGANPSQVYQNLMYQFSLNYSRLFGRHEVTGLAVFKRQQWAMGSNFPSYREEWAGRVTYNYDQRYLLEVNGAYNGSEKFGPGYKFGFFPSVAGGWVLSNEPFMEGSKSWLDNFKLRFSWGMVGSDNLYCRREVCIKSGNERVFRIF